MIDPYIYVIIALLPLASLMLVFQVNPYQALVVRAILGAVAALVYAVLGAADVALTEALVGTMLAVTLYVIAVRSSLVMRLGIVSTNDTSEEDYLTEILDSFKKVIYKYHLRLELVKYPNAFSLNKALKNQEVHGIIKENHSASNPTIAYQTAFRVHRLFEIMQAELTAPQTTLIYSPVIDEDKKH